MGVRSAFSRKARTLLACTIVLGSTSIGIAVANADDPTVAYSSSPRAFSPNGDDQEDTYSAQVTTPTAGSLRTSVLAADGAVVKQGSDASVAAGTTDVTWDGRRADGSQAPDAAYRVVVTFQPAAGGAPQTAEQATRVDTRLPGRVSVPTNGAEISGTTAFAFTGTTGFALDAVTFVAVQRPTTACGYYVQRCQITGATPKAGTDDWTATGDVTALGSGAGTISADVSYKDALGAAHVYRAEPVSVTYRPALAFARVDPERAFTPNGDGLEDSLNLAFTTTAPASAATMTVLQGDAIVFAARSVALGGTDTAYGTASWSGQKTDGSPAPDGAYRVRITVTDERGASESVERRSTVTRSDPATVEKPVSGATIGDLVSVVVAPANGVDVTSVVAYGKQCVQYSTRCGYTAAFTKTPGKYTGAVDVSGFATGANELIVSVMWNDGYGVSHTSPLATPVTVENPAKLTLDGAERSISPDALDSRTVGFDYSLNVAATVAAEVANAAGVVVRSLTPVPSSEGSLNGRVTWDGRVSAGTTAPLGEYKVTVRAQGSVGTASTQLRRVSVIADPITITAPVTGAVVSGAVTVKIAAASGVAIGSSYARVGTRQLGGLSIAGAAGEATFTLDANDGASPTLLVDSVWYDAYGTYHSSQRTVAVTNQTPAATPRITTARWNSSLVSPDGDGADDSAYDDVVVGAGAGTVTIDVVDDAGARVRRLVNAQPYVSQFSRSDAWNVKDDAGDTVVDGPYRLRVRVVPSTGAVVEQYSTAIRVDTREIATFQLPVARSTVSDKVQVEIKPTVIAADPVTIQPITVCAYNCATIYAASPDGVWRTTLDIGNTPSGDATLRAGVPYQRADGVEGQRVLQLPVKVDNDRPRLTATYSPPSGDAPFAANLVLDATDLQGGALAYEIKWGDGKPDASGFIAEPYAAKSVPHTFAEAGTYAGTVSLRDPQNHVVSQSIRIVVSKPPNRRPVATLTAAPLKGTSVHQVTFSASATDADGDALTYKLIFGDGTERSGSLPSAPFTHDYASAGTRQARLEVSDAQVQAATSVTITTRLPGELRAIAGDSIVAAPGAEITLDGTGSTPSLGIERYRWQFGDGSADADGAAVRHRYAAAGTYTATLTVTADGEQRSATTKITVQTPAPAKELKVTVRDGQGVVVGADALVILPGGERISAPTGGDGVATLTNLPDGAIKVYASKDGYIPGAVTANVSGGVGNVQVTLVKGEAASATLTSKPMTREQIIAAGIDPNDPANQHVYEFEAHLAAAPGRPASEISGYATGGGWVARLNGVLCAALRCDLGDGSSVTFRPGKAPMLQWLVLPGKASFLKEFFSVQMLVQNLASADFTLTGGQATLALPSGLSLAPTSTPQAPTRPLPDILGGGSAATTWVVRGDTEGSYDLSASYRAQISPIDEVVEINARTSKPLKVWGGSALTMTVETDDAVSDKTPFRVRVGLKNVADVPVYNAAISFDDAAATGAILQPREQKVDGTDTIAPGATFWTHDYVFVPHVTGNRHIDVSKAFIRQVGGDVSLKSTIVTRPAEKVPDIDSKLRSGKVILDWEVVPGASDYRVYSTPDQDTPFAGGALVTSSQTVAAAGRMKVSFTPKSPNEVYAVSPVIGGKAKMVHPLIGAGNEDKVAYPLISLVPEPTCRSTNGTLNIKVSDPDYPVSVTETALIDTADPDKRPAESQFKAASAPTTFSLEFEARYGPRSLFIRSRNSEQVATQGAWASRRVPLSACRYIAFGDSYTSGEGLTRGDDKLEYDCGTDLHDTDYREDTTVPWERNTKWKTSDCDTRTLTKSMPNDFMSRSKKRQWNLCHRHERAYPNQLRTAMRLDGADYQFLACSGAVTPNIGFTPFKYPQYKETSPRNVAGGKTQLDTVAESFKDQPPSLVTIGIGGNDAGFSDIIKACITEDCLNRESVPNFPQQVVNTVQSSVFYDLRTTFKGLRKRFPDATVVAVGYPSIVGDPDRYACAQVGIGHWKANKPELLWLRNTLIPEINDAIEKAAGEAGVYFADITEATAGGELCSEDDARLINGWRSGDDADLGPLDDTTGNESFHPNQLGHDAIAKTLKGMLLRDDGSVKVANPAPKPDSGGAGSKPIYIGKVDATPQTSCGVNCLQPANTCIQGCAINVTGTGFAPGSTVRVVVHSDPVELGTLVADDTGSISGRFVLPGSIPAGEHRLEVTGTTADGKPQIGTSPLVVASSGPGPVDPDPGTGNPDPDTGNPDPGTGNPGTGNPDPGTGDAGGGSNDPGRGGGSPPAGQQTPLATLAPTISGVRVAPTKAKPGKGKKPAAPVVLSFSLSAPARVVVTARSVGEGLLSGKRCVKPTAKLKKAKAKRCELLKDVASQTLSGLPAGAGKLTLTGLKLGGKTLKTGKYKLQLVATNAAGQSSLPATAALTVKGR